MEKFWITLLFVLISTARCEKIDQKPSFSEDPVDSLNIITKGAVLSCKSVNALNAWFECSKDERFIEKRQTGQSYVDPQTGVRHIEVQLEVKRKNGHHRMEVQCWCMAYGGHQTIVSRKASLQFAREEPTRPPPPPPPPATQSNRTHHHLNQRKRDRIAAAEQEKDVAERSSSPPSSGSKKSSPSSPAFPEMFFLPMITTCFLFLLIVCLIIFVLRERQKKNVPLRTDLLVTPTMLQHPNQPDLVRGDKMQMVTGLNNFNTLEHCLVIPSNGQLHHTPSGTPNNFRSQQMKFWRVEPDYAEPTMINNSNHLQLSHMMSEQKPPLPRSSPPNRKSRR